MQPCNRKDDEPEDQAEALQERQQMTIHEAVINLFANRLADLKKSLGEVLDNLESAKNADHNIMRDAYIADATSASSAAISTAAALEDVASLLPSMLATMQPLPPPSEQKTIPQPNVNSHTTTCR